MDNEKSDYQKGLLYYCCLMICICSFFTTPDRDTLFYKFMGLFGISPGIQIGENATLYVYMLIPLLIAILSIRKVFAYWWHYGSRFREYSKFLRYFPLLITVVVFLVSANMENIFYAVISRRSGLQSVVCYATNDRQLSYKFTGNIRTYSYDLTFENWGDEIIECKVKFLNDEVNSYDLPDTFIKDDNGEVKIFTLLPRQKTNYKSEFTEYHKTEDSSGVGYYSRPSFVLLNDDEQYSPKPIIKSPRRRN